MKNLVFILLLSITAMAQGATTLERDLEMARNGDASAQYNLGVRYGNGRGVLQDDQEEVKWYRLAADLGYASAQYNLGIMYQNGQGVLQDDKEAVKWYRLAAKHGDASAQNNLSASYYLGRGVLTNYIVSYSWINIARYNGHTGTDKIFKLLAEEMSNSDVSEAQALSKRCLESDYKDCG